jgi:hypothetical protein
MDVVPADIMYLPLRPRVETIEQPAVDRAGELMIGNLEGRALLLVQLNRKQVIGYVEAPVRDIRYGGADQLVTASGQGEIRLWSLAAMAAGAQPPVVPPSNRR